MNSARLCSLAGRYDYPIPTRFLAPIDCLKIPALAGRYDNPIPTRFLAPIDCLKIPAQLITRRSIQCFRFLLLTFIQLRHGIPKLRLS
jgi:hypothetical protein